MSTSVQQLNRFFQACDKLMSEKYMVADARIQEVLRSIAESRALTDLFSAVTERFDYPSAKKTYLRFPATNTAFHGKAYLPEDRGETLAFVFCLLVDIDAGRIKLDEFLLRYFYEDGSYTASFAMFAERMLRPFRDIVKECFPDVAKRQPVSEEGFPNTAEADAALNAFAACAIEERTRLKSVALSVDDAAAGDAILAEIVQSAGKNNVPAIMALLTGYRYFLRALFIEGGDELFHAAKSLNG